ncbi:uncharacterized protein LOC104859823 isoform X2 [Fukomys damarensis]|uniref:Uncharacterized protein n=1 Tax=Fukomys damarensis TaxID=885580 RepID=A0A091DRP7_FUKDA|nr:uncharacterized protein LOC104859823 isoform X2 [Fukomys damarensis]KFO34809.1 hypothetical protein H920_03837 [Fukomys damarensis]
MEVLEEFDSEFPHTVTFCQLISVAEFKRQATTYTESALRRLFHTLDRDPVLAERVLRKSKQAECERRGLLSFLWAKFLSAVQGPLNLCNSMGAQEMVQRLKQLKRSILRVHLYARGAKKKRRKFKLKKPEPILLHDRSTSPCLPPTLLPPPPLPSLPPPVTSTTSVAALSPPVYTTPRVFGPFPPLPSKPMEKLDISRSEVKLHWNGLSSNPKSHMIDLTPLVLNRRGFHLSYLPRHSPHKLHCSGFPWTSACSGCSSSEKTVVCAVNTSFFTPPGLRKYQPVPRPKGDSENDSAESKAHERSP